MILINKLHENRQEIYRSASRFHAEMAKYFTALTGDTFGVDIDTTKMAAREAGNAYNVALVSFLKHLKSLPLGEELRAEAERAERTISLLSFELSQL
jgi:hypothetical protein